jgi:hypothetical protein
MQISNKARLPLRGSVSIKVTDKNGKVIRVSNPNSIIVDSTRLILAQLIPSSLFSSVGGTIVKPGRPTVTLDSDGPTNANAIGYIRLGYTTSDTLPGNASAGPEDTSMISGLVSTVKISEAQATYDSINFTASINVTGATSNRKYYEAALYTVGQGNESVPESPNTSTMLMFAHQVHSLISAPEGATITYDWTITIPE